MVGSAERERPTLDRKGNEGDVPLRAGRREREAEKGSRPKEMAACHGEVDASWNPTHC